MERTRPDVIKIFYEEQDVEQKRKIDEINQMLGATGLTCLAINIDSSWYDGRGPGPATPWLKYDGYTYYDFEIDAVITQLIETCPAPPTGPLFNESTMEGIEIGKN